MNEAYRCPNCGSLGTRYRRTRGDHVCQRCGHQWAQSGVRTRRTRIKGLVIVALVLTGMGVGFASAGNFVLLAIAGLFWSYTFFFLWRGSSNDSEDSESAEYVVLESGEIAEQNDGAYYCTNPDCELELLDDEEFCTECGTRRMRPLADTQYLVCGSSQRELEPTTQF